MDPIGAHSQSHIDSVVDDQTYLHACCCISPLSQVKQLDSMQGNFCHNVSQYRLGRCSDHITPFMNAYKVSMHASLVRCLCCARLIKAGLNAYPSRSGDFHELLSFMHKGAAIS